jgi:S1-C subfamily serine protease
MIATIKSNTYAISTVVTALFVLVLSALSLLTFQAQSMVQANSISSYTAPNVSAAQSSSHSLLNTVFRQVQNSVVEITSKIPVPTTDQSNPQAKNATALGSGFIYDKQGHIITNNHVVGDAKIVDVTFVIAIGNPFGLSDTLTTGIVSGVGRLLPSSGAAGFSIPNAIQTDAPINPGNSGGPLLNMQGQVVGINTAILSDTGNGFSGLGFAVPSNTVAKVVPMLIQKSMYPHPYLGAKIATLTSDILQNVTGLPATSNFKGAYVDTITKNGPADKAGIHGSTTDQYSKKHIGDIIIAVDRHPIVRSDDLISYIEQHKSVGDSVTLTVYRNGHKLDLKATLTARPSPLPFLPVQLAPSPLPHPSPPLQPPRQTPTPPHP